MCLRRAVASSATAAAAVAGLVFPVGQLRAQAAADYSGLSAAFLDPAGAVSPRDSVAVRLRLTLAADAPALRFDALSPATNYGLPAGFVPTTGRAPDGSRATFASYRAPQTTVGFGCPNGFGPLATPTGVPPAPCGGTAYLFTPNAAGAAPTFFYLRAFTLLPGASFDFLVGTFAPQGAGAPSGVYELDRLAPSITFFGADSAGRPLIAEAQLARTCPAAPGPDCGFVRTVGAPATVPEPRPVVLVALGAAALAMHGATRRRHV